VGLEHVEYVQKLVQRRHLPFDPNAMVSLDTASTLLDLFENIARSEVDLDAVECGEERWTYGELDVISTGLALEMYKAYGQKPVVAIVSENHPYILAMVLATWKLGGVVAPLDYNVPRDILERMLLDIKPTLVSVPSNQLHVQKAITGNVGLYLV
jgi:non-ribosomal peptide synthetase component F